MVLEAVVPAALAALGGIVWTKGLEGRIGVSEAKIAALEKNNDEIKETVDKIYEHLIKRNRNDKS